MSIHEKICYVCGKKEYVTVNHTKSNLIAKTYVCSPDCKRILLKRRKTSVGLEVSKTKPKYNWSNDKCER